ncbi:MarR family winged helix-turn-helix transcriptional regulator [Williamsia sp. SKLECPSW1]
MGEAAREDGPRPLDAAEARVWRALARGLIVVPRALEADLLAHSGMTSGEYQVLVILSEAPERRCRMSELATAVGLSASRMTRLIDGLRRRGYVDKARDGCDRRGAVAVLRPEGLAALEAAYPGHLAAVRDLVISRLGDLDLDALATAFETMAEAGTRRGA